MSELSSHIPDLDLITYYSEKGNTIFSKMSPWTKAIMLVIIIVFITMSKSLLAISVLYLAILAVYWMAQLPRPKAIRMVRAAAALRAVTGTGACLDSAGHADLHAGAVNADG